MVLVSLTAFRVREVLKWRVEGACWVGLSVCSVVGRLDVEVVKARECVSSSAFSRETRSCLLPEASSFRRLHSARSPDRSWGRLRTGRSVVRRG